MLIDFVELLLDSTSRAAIRRHYHAALRTTGFSNILYIGRFLTDVPDAIAQSDAEIFSTFPDESLDHMLKFCDIHGRIWREGQAGDVVPPDTPGAARFSGEVRLLVDRFGGAVARVLSLREPSLRTSCTIVMNSAPDATEADVRKLWSRHGRDITALSWILHIRLATLAARALPGELTMRQREVLEWASEGKTVAEIATILGLTNPTVEKHLRLARETLDAATTAQAILKAYIRNQIFVANPRCSDQAVG